MAFVSIAIFFLKFEYMMALCKKVSHSLKRINKQMHEKRKKELKELSNTYWRN
jgi:hypothetical protein